MVKNKVEITLSFKIYSQLLTELNCSRIEHLDTACIYTDDVSLKHQRERFWEHYRHYLLITDLLKELDFDVTLDFGSHLNLQKCEQYIKDSEAFDLLEA